MLVRTRTGRTSHLTWLKIWPWNGLKHDELENKAWFSEKKLLNSHDDQFEHNQRDFKKPNNLTRYSTERLTNQALHPKVAQKLFFNQTGHLTQRLRIM